MSTSQEARTSQEHFAQVLRIFYIILNILLKLKYD